MNIHYYPVKYALMHEFRLKAESEGCVVQKVVEQIGRQLILFSMSVPDGKDELITDFAFMTFIKNPEFQKYYNLDEDALKRISEDDKYFKWVQEQKLKTNKR